jgi:isocitrate dehydrogenase
MGTRPFAGSTPQDAGQDKVISDSVIVSGVIRLEYMGWNEAARMIEKGKEAAIAKGTVTYDVARQTKKEGRTDVTEIKCSEFGSQIIENMA